MSKKISKLEPANVFGYFEELSTIPRCSGHCQAASNYLVEFAKGHQLEYTQDEMGNVVIFKPASEGREEDTTVMLQGHMDMVCVKTPTSHFNFEEDALRLRVEGDYLYSLHTSLGGDDGIAVAMILAILDDDSLSTPPIEAVFTVDEEIGLLGAKAMDFSQCKAGYLINLDSEDDSVIWAGCAGGLSATCTMPVTKESFRGTSAKVTVTGLKGGHSGSEIDKERANANSIMGRALHKLTDICLFSIVELEGGKADNAIPSVCEATISLDLNDQYFIDSHIVGKAPEDYKEKKLKEVKNAIRELHQELRSEYKDTDENLILSIDVKDEKLTKCIDVLDTQKVIFFLANCPSGVHHMSKTVEGLVETSSNLGIVSLKEDHIEYIISVRSSIESRKNYYADKLKLLIQFLGGDCVVSGEYPGWEVRKESKLRKVMGKVYKDMYGEKPEVTAIHAGLECGYILQKMPELDIVSIGPNILDIHSTEEKLSISSTKKMYKYIVKVLATLK